MERFRKIKFQNYVLLYSMCLIGIFIVVATIFILNIKIDIPEQIQGYYVSVDGAVFTENGLLIPLDGLERSVVTDQEIHSLFIPYYVSIITRTTLTAFTISLILSFVFAHILTGKIIKPIEETANSLKNKETALMYLLKTLVLASIWNSRKKSLNPVTESGAERKTVTV